MGARFVTGQLPQDGSLRRFRYDRGSAWRGVRDEPPSPASSALDVKMADRSDTDPSATPLSPPPAKKARMDNDSEWIRVPPDGLCLAYCCVAASDVAAWGPRDANGHAAGRANTSWQQAAGKEFQARIVGHMRAAGGGGAVRAAALEDRGLPIDSDIPFFAAELGRAIAVRTPD